MRIACLVLIAACGTTSPPDIVGPFTGEVHTYHVDSFTFAMNAMDARDLGDDLDGDGTVNNQLGASTAALADLGMDLTTHASDMIASGVIASTIEIQADDQMNDPSAGVRYVGAPGADAIEVGGSLAGGAFVSNRTATAHHLGTAMLHLPILEDVDPVVFELDDMEIDLAPDGSGGYNAHVRGLAGPEVLHIAATALAQMIAANPADHAGLVQLVDNAQTGRLDADSIAQAPLMQSLLTPDIDRDRTHYVSVGFAVHLSATAPGGTPADRCHDRVLDPGESDIDCGGSCLPCAGGQTCGSAADCQSQLCTGAGTCIAVTCHDLVRDGLETGVDCGGWECAPCR